MIGVMVRSARVWGPTVVVTAVLQALTVLPGATPAPTPAFVLLAVASLVVTVLAAAVLAGGALAAAGVPAGRGPVLVWAVSAGVLAFVVAVLAPPVVPLVLIGPLCLLPAGAGFGVFRAVRVRAVLAVLGTLVLAVLAWVAALLLGLFVTGALGAGPTWLVLGLAAVMVLSGWSAVHRRAGDARPAGRDGPETRTAPTTAR